MDFSLCQPVVKPLDLVVGGLVDPEELVGRTRELTEIQNGVTTALGVVLVGDRRMGKTSVLRKLEATWAEAGHDVIFVSAQTVNASTFAGRLMERLTPMTWFARERKRWTLDIDVSYKGLRLRRTGGKAPEPEIDLLAWAAERAAPKTLIVMIDEVPVLLGAMSPTKAEAEEFMNSLRAARQEHTNLIVVLAGSIGLHHVLPPGSGHVNDLQTQALGPLDPCSALGLALGLLERLEADCHRREFAEAVVTATDAIPYYIQWSIQQTSLDQDWRRDPLDRLRAAMADPLDPLDFRHYIARIPGYYGPQAAIVYRMLDAYATSDGLTIAELDERLRRDAGGGVPRRQDLVELVFRLQRDHYLVPSPHSKDRFASRLLATAWRIMRRLDDE